MTTMPIRDVRLFVEVVGRGCPLALMHGGPGRSLGDAAVPATGGPVHRRLLRPSLQRTAGRLSEIKVPTLVMAGRDDFVFPPEHQGQLAAGIPNARLEIVERTGHNPHDEPTA